jgi:probable HAF family extracellular repeat protein
MRRKILYGIVTLTLFCLGVSPLLFAADYHFTKIDVPDSGLTEARGINARGDIVGGYEDAEHVRHGFLLRNGVFSSIDVPGASSTLGARSINARGDIVGNFEGTDGVQHGYLLRDGQFTQIDYPGASGSALLGINNAGDVTGTHFDNEESGSGFLLKDGVFQDVQVPRGLTTDVFFAQDNGRVLVGQTTTPPDGGFHGFVRNKPGHFELIDFPGTSVPCTGLRRINQRGDIVGFFSNVDRVEDCTGDESHGFVLRDGQYERIDVPGSTSTRALAINDDGVIVGSFTDRKGNTHGFKAVPNH